MSCAPVGRKAFTVARVARTVAVYGVLIVPQLGREESVVKGLSREGSE